MTIAVTEAQGIARVTRKFLRTDAAAEYLGLPAQTLADMRSDGRGPRYLKHRRIVWYLVSDLDLWTLSHGRMVDTENSS